jgi:hypothetical protein
MELDPSNEHINGPLTPASPGMDKSDDLRISVDVDDNKPKYTRGGGLKEPPPIDPDSDGSHHEQEKLPVSADDCNLPFSPQRLIFSQMKQ